MKDSSLRTLVLILLVLYILSPVDAVPGPFDDVVIAVLGYALVH